MSGAKTSNEGQMGSGESDDEFYNVKLPNTTATVSDSKDVKAESVKKKYSPPRTKVTYDYKFDSSSDDESDSVSHKSEARSSSGLSGRRQTKEATEEGSQSDESKLPQSTSRVVEKINEELKNMKNNNRGKSDKSDPATSSAKHIPTSSVGVVPPVVVVPPPMIVPQPHSVMAMGPTGMIVPPVIGNQMIPPMIRGPTGLMRMTTPSMIQTPTNVVGMTNDLLRLQGNLMGIPQIPPAMAAGLCMTGNVIPVQAAAAAAALQGNIMGGNLMSGQGSLLGTPSNMMTGAGGVMINPAMTVTNIMNSQMGNPILNMNNLVANQGGRLGTSYSGGALNSGVVGQQSSRSGGCDVAAGKQSSGKSERSSRRRDSPDRSDSDGKNEDGEEEEDGSSSAENSRSANPAVREIPFKNDGSFMEMFKKMSEAKSKASSNKDDKSSTGESKDSSDRTTSSSSSAAAALLKKPPVVLSGIVGKRRGGRVLKTGMVKKVKKAEDGDDEKGPKDAWAMYMAEVKKYREASCEEEGKTRPLVK